MLHITRVHVPAGAGGVVEVLHDWLEALPAPVDGTEVASSMLLLLASVLVVGVGIWDVLQRGSVVRRHVRKFFQWGRWCTFRSR